MSISNMIAKIIMEMLERDGFTEIQRNEMAEELGCVPSQINYVISSRFTPEHGYIVESRRGGGGYIRITRANYNSDTMLMHVINNIGNELDEKTCRSHLYNLTYQNLLDREIADFIMTITSENCFRHLSPKDRNLTRASIFKQVILNAMGKDL